MVTVLPNRNGFAQRHINNPMPSSYLRDIIPIPQNLVRSNVNLGLIRQDIFQFRSESKIQPDDQYLRLAISDAHQAFQLPEKVKMIHLNDVFQQDLSIWKSSPGLPWKDLGYLTKDDIRNDPDAIRRIRFFWHKIKHGDLVHPPDSCAFVRAHICERGENKVRAVWGYPATMTFGEAVFAIPLIRAYKTRVHSPIAYGYETAVGGARMISDQIGQYEHKAAIDFKSFDKTVPSWLIDVAFDILTSNIDFSHYDGYGVADARRNYFMLQYIKEYFKHTSIRLANGERYRKHSGVASGSYFTQLIDSIVNYIIMQWICLKQTGAYPGFIKVLGDDSILGLDHYLDLFEANLLVRSIGMAINMRKSAVSRCSTELTFLGFAINGGFPKKSHSAWLAALAFPETPDTKWDHVASRALGLAYANSMIDSHFHHICEYIVNRQPFELEFNRSTARMLTAMGIDVRTVRKRLPSSLEFCVKLRML